MIYLYLVLSQLHIRLHVCQNSIYKSPSTGPPALQVGGAWVALYLWGFMLALSIFFMTIYPTVIAPLFNKFESLPEVRSYQTTSMRIPHCTWDRTP